MKKDSLGVPLKHGWRANGDWKPSNVRSPYIRLSLKQLWDVLPFIFRFLCYWLRHWRKRETFFIDTFRPLTLFPYYGVPCGGIGSGSIGRDFRGAFCKFSLRPGLVEHQVVNVPENQFIVNILRDDKTVYQQVLTAAQPVPKNKMAAWKFNFPPENLSYVGLYPRSWTVFKIPEQKINLCCRQISPVFPNNYDDTCLPVTVFVWTVENYGSEEAQVTICFTFRNGTGDPRWRSESDCKWSTDSTGNIRTVSLEHSIDGMMCDYGLAVKRTSKEMLITARCFDVNRDGSDIWKDLLRFSSQNSTTDDPDFGLPLVEDELGVAIIAQTLVKPEENSEIEMCLAWYMPVVSFLKRQRNYTRRYAAKYFSSAELCVYALNNYENWEQKIEEWQNPVLKNDDLPKWYRTALFNELYYLTDGGSVWFSYDDSWRLDEPHLSNFTLKLMKKYGRFAYLESFEYRMFTTYDVHFYSSFAFAMLFPGIQLCIQAEYCDQIQNEDKRTFKFFFEGEIGYIKTKNRVPHDLGCPGAEPWLETNAYLPHDTSKWKDLNLKFILTSMRDYMLIEDKKEKKQFLNHVWPNVQALIDVGLQEWDPDHDGMIENSGSCDQTYDTWRMKGTSAYCGSLWLAALKCAKNMAEILEDEEKCESYKSLLKGASAIFDDKLWRNDYYKFDEQSRDHTVIMADQLCGFWYLCACGLENGVLPEDRVEKSIRKVYEFNVCKFQNGKLGAVNGMMPDGTVDCTSMQSEEVWTGVTYGLASLMIHQGMKKEGFKTAEGIYCSNFGPLGLQFQSPEAVYEKNYYRAIGYMRAMAIWAIQWVLKRQEKSESSQNSVERRSNADENVLKIDEKGPKSDEKGHESDKKGQKVDEKQH